MLTYCMCGCIFEGTPCPNCNKVTDKDTVRNLSLQNKELERRIKMLEAQISLSMLALKLQAELLKGESHE